MSTAQTERLIEQYAICLAENNKEGSVNKKRIE